MITKWETDNLPNINAENTLTRVDVTVETLQRSKRLEADETFIGTKVIDVNIKRELPRIFAFLTESSRFLLFKGLESADATMLELWFAQESRIDAWFVPHVQAFYAGAIHGKSFVEILCAKDSVLGTTVEFVAQDEFIYNGAIKDIQMLGMVARKYTVAVTYLRMFGKELAFSVEKLTQIEETYTKDAWEATTALYKIYYRRDADNAVMCRWYSTKISEFITEEILHCSGAFEASGEAVPSKAYPFISYRYTLTADTMFDKMQGRAAYDEPLQEAIQALTTSYVNGSVRASGFYPYVDSNANDGGNTLKQLEGTGLVHNRVATQKLSVFQPNYPASDMLNAVQLLKTTASNDAGQVDFATITKRMTNTTATEIAASSEQSQLMSSVGVAMLAIYLYLVESYRFKIFRQNVKAHKNAPPAVVAKLSMAIPISVVDEQFRSRDEKMQLAKQWLALLKGTPAFLPLLLVLVKDEIPQHSDLIEKALAQPDTGNISTAMYQLLLEVGKAAPELAQDENFRRIIETARGVFGGGSTPPLDAPPANAAVPVEPTATEEGIV